MSGYLWGLATIPALAAAAVLLYLTVIGAMAFHRRFLSWKPEGGHRCYAYIVKAAEGSFAGEMIGSTILERRNLGPKYTYRIEHDGERTTVLHAERAKGGGRAWSSRSVQWDDETLGELDEALEEAGRA